MATTNTMPPFAIFESTLQERFGGRLQRGSHQPNGEACLLEAAHVSIGAPLSDTPDLWPDLRPLNDALWSSDTVRAEYLTPVLRAYWNWSVWPEKKKVAVMERIAVLTVNLLIAELSCLPADIKAQCKEANTIAESAAAAAGAAGTAWAAAEAAGAAKAAAGAAAEAAKAAAWAAAGATAEAAKAAAWAAAGAAAEAAEAADKRLIVACHLWIQAAQQCQEGEP